MINTRNGHLVIGRHAVPVREVTNAVCDRQDMDYICSRYPLKPDEVMECIDCIADLDNLDHGIHLELNNGSDEVGKVTIETRQMSDTFFVKTIQFGKIFLPQEADFNMLYDKGFRMCAIESFEDVLNNSVGYESSDLHLIVYNAIMDITDEQFDEELFVEFMKEQDEAT